MKKNLLMTIFIVVVVIFVSIFLIQLRDKEDTWLCQGGVWVKQGQPSASKPTTDCANQLTTSTNQTASTTYGTSTTTTTTTTNSNNNQPEANITISSPLANATINQVFTIAGQARVFESALVVRVLNVAGTTKFFEKSVMAAAPDTGQFGLYYYNVDLSEYPQVKAGELSIEALDYSAKDGSEIDKVTTLVHYVPIKVEPGKMILKAYFSNSRFNLNVNPCSAVFAVLRQVDNTPASGKAAIEALLRGPSELEKLEQFSTSINPGTVLQKLTIVDGVARVDFSAALSQTAGSCNVAAVNAQITETLKQFKTVKQVIISVNGQTEGILEP